MRIGNKQSGHAKSANRAFEHANCEAARIILTDVDGFGESSLAVVWARLIGRKAHPPKTRPDQGLLFTQSSQAERRIA